MKVSREQMAENRERILDVASRLFRERGFEAVGVSEVMKAAGLTHGGFYGHFSSKDDLIVHALAHALGGRNGAKLSLDEYMAEYLSIRHRDNQAGGCPVSGLAADTLRQTPQARAIITDGVQAQLDWMTERSADANQAGSRRQAIGSWSTMVGATILSRVMTDPALSREILAETLAWLECGSSRATAGSGQAPKPAIID